jgi:hypothetical protein
VDADPMADISMRTIDGICEAVLHPDAYRVPACDGAAARTPHPVDQIDGTL